MNGLTCPGAPSLLRLIVELKGSSMPSSPIFLLELGERDPDVLADELEDLTRAGLVGWSDQAQQWTPTMRGLMLGIALPAYDPANQVSPTAVNNDERAA